MRDPGRTPSVADDFGHTLSLQEVLTVLKISRTTAKRRLESGTFPVPHLPRRGHEPYRFAARHIDHYLARAMAAVS